MAFLPGWDRDRLRTAPPADVEAARVLLYAQARKPVLDLDIDTRIAEIKRVDMAPKAREREESNLRKRAIEQLTTTVRKSQAAIRELLGLDDDDA